MVLGSSSSASTTVRIEVTVHTAAAPEAETEWVVVEEEPAARTLDPAVRDRLAARLTSKKASRTSLDRITSAFETGLASADLDLTVDDLHRPAGTGLQNSCWLGVRVDHTVWLATKHRTATQRLRKERGTRLVAFASQAEAEAWCLGYGLAELPPSI